MKKFILLWFVLLSVAYFSPAMELPSTAVSQAPTEKVMECMIHSDLRFAIDHALKAHALVESVHFMNVETKEGALYWNVRLIAKQALAKRDCNYERFYKLFCGDQLGKNAKKKLKNIVAAYEHLNVLIRTKRIVCNNEVVDIADRSRWSCKEISNLITLCELARIKTRAIDYQSIFSYSYPK